MTAFPVTHRLATLSYGYAPDRKEKLTNRTTGSVLVTGASSGIGRACAVMMAADGWHVFAGVRDEQAAACLSDAKPGRITPISLDITEDANVEAAGRSPPNSTANR